LIVASSTVLLFISCLPNKLTANGTGWLGTSGGAGENHTGAAAAARPSTGSGELILKLKDQASLSQSGAVSSAWGLISSVCGENSAAEIRPLLTTEPQRDGIASIFAAHGIDRTYVVRLNPGWDVTWAIARLEASGLVEFAEPNRKVKLGSVMPNDPDFQDQWALLNRGYPIDGFDPTPGADIHAEDAWTITTGRPDVLVAVVDTGVDIKHPDLVDNIYTNTGVIHNGYPNDINGFNVADHNNDVTDVFGHGTQIAGIIAGVLNNRIGISGVCQCKILPVKFFRRTGPDPTEVDGTVADAAAGIIYAVTVGADIINASWTTLLAPGEVSPTDSQALKDACAAARDADVLMVCIAGNDGFNLDYSTVYPASYEMPNQINVAASDYNDQIWHVPGADYEIRTGFGPKTVHLAAPGISILSTQARGTCPLCSLSTNPDDWYSSIDGSSASAGFVSGVAALVKSQYPEANGPVLRQRILAGVDVLDSLEMYVISSGRLSAYGALTAQIAITPPALNKLKYKAGNETLLLIGQGMVRGAFAVVGGTRYPTAGADPADANPSRLTAKVPSDAFPSGVSVPVVLLNPDGGLSQEIDITR